MANKNKKIKNVKEAIPVQIISDMCMNIHLNTTSLQSELNF